MMCKANNLKVTPNSNALNLANTAAFTVSMPEKSSCWCCELANATMARFIKTWDTSRKHCPKEALHQSKPVIASAAKQSIFACQPGTYGSPRRCAPRDDGRMRTFPQEALHQSKPVIASAAKQSIFACQPGTYGSPRRCAPRDDGRMRTFPNYFRLPQVVFTLSH